MLCEHYFLLQVKNIGSIKRYFHAFPFQDCFVFHLITLFLKGLLVLSDLLKPAFEKKQRTPHGDFCIINDYERKINYTGLIKTWSQGLN